MLSEARLATALLVFCSFSSLAGDIYRHRTADGRIVFTDDPAAPPHTIESTKLDNLGGRLLALVPGAQQATPAERDRAQAEVRVAESNLMRAYNRLTAGVLPRPDEILQTADPTPPVRGRPVRLPKTPEYYERIGALKADITLAQERLDEARTRFHAMK